MVTRGAADGRGKTWINWVQQDPTAQTDHRDRLGPAASRDLAPHATPALHAARGRTGAPSGCSARWRARARSHRRRWSSSSSRKAWPSFAAQRPVRGSARGGNANTQLDGDLQLAGEPDDYVYTLRRVAAALRHRAARGGAVVCGAGRSRCCAAVFIVEFAPPRDARACSSRSCACSRRVPSVVYGLIGILVLVPFVDNHLIDRRRKESVAYVVQLDRPSAARRRR